VGECVHPRSQNYTDDLNRTRCGACGDVWDDTWFNGIGGFRPLEPVVEAKPRVIIVDVRNGIVRADGTNIDLPPEGQESALRSIETADVLVEIHPDTMIVKQGVDKGWVTMFTTKSAAQLNAEKSDRELAHRTDNPTDDLKVGEHPVDTKFKRVWDGSVPSGEPVEGGLKGY
jgi:hypothetical protein